MPDISFRIYEVAGKSDAYVVVGVSGVRFDGIEVVWSLSLQASDSCLDISAQVEVETHGGYDPVFQVFSTTEHAHEAATLIAENARAVCAQRRWLINE
jgi:hypothetical protein